MSGFKFDLGEAVRFATFWHNTPSGTFIVVGRHGEHAPDPAYRIRSLDDGSLRLGIESELAPAGDRAAGGARRVDQPLPLADQDTGAPS